MDENAVTWNTKYNVCHSSQTDINIPACCFFNVLLVKMRFMVHFYTDIEFYASTKNGIVIN